MNVQRWEMEQVSVGEHLKGSTKEFQSLHPIKQFHQPSLSASISHAAFI